MLCLVLNSQHTQDETQLPTGPNTLFCSVCVCLCGCAVSLSLSHTHVKKQETVRAVGLVSFLPLRAKAAKALKFFYGAKSSQKKTDYIPLVSFGYNSHQHSPISLFPLPSFQQPSISTATVPLSPCPTAGGEIISAPAPPFQAFLFLSLHLTSSLLPLLPTARIPPPPPFPPSQGQVLPKRPFRPITELQSACPPPPFDCKHCGVKLGRNCLLFFCTIYPPSRS